MKTVLVIRLMLLVGLAAVPGCATHALWAEADLGGWCRPAGDATLRLFHPSDSQDILVVYEEVTEGHQGRRPRAYFLFENISRIKRQQPPKFVKIISNNSLDPVPVFSAGDAVSVPAPTTFAVISADKTWFTLYSTRGPAGPYALPAYLNEKGKMERLALTPLAATTDLSLIGGAVYGLYVAGRNGYLNGLTIP